MTLTRSGWTPLRLPSERWENEKVMQKHPRYQDYVIRDGKFVGEFEEMYRDHADPWHQTQTERYASEKAVAINLIERLQPRSVVEIGCGLGQFTARIAKVAPVTGLDISETAIAKAREKHPGIGFETASIEQHEVFKRLAPDVIVMAEISWYVLPQLRDFLDFLRSELPDTKLIHLLTTYAPGVQKYGSDYFTELPGILRFFGMDYLETGQVNHPNGEARTWFCGQW